jgi:hypothetical protein
VQLEPVEQAALAFARWQGLTDEDDIDREAAKRALDRSLADLDAQGPDAWKGLEDLASDLGDTAIVGLMKHSLQQSVEQARAQIAELEADAACAATIRVRTQRQTG